MSNLNKDMIKNLLEEQKAETKKVTLELRRRKDDYDRIASIWYESLMIEELLEKDMGRI